MWAALAVAFAPLCNTLMTMQLYCVIQVIPSRLDELPLRGHAPTPPWHCVLVRSRFTIAQLITS